jgi:hypothetical protein
VVIWDILLFLFPFVVVVAALGLNGVWMATAG